MSVNAMPSRQRHDRASAAALGAADPGVITGLAATVGSVSGSTNEVVIDCAEPAMLAAL
ncbi:hypothetical protein [Cellulomonas carbonis]|uniref:hypothetical protein n=1 Tax=Cellulomonas carbonis TaxID=1386092 RepID=UPI0013783365|nr:hypothetical protein [Cellulomonas carbonis]